MINIKVDSALHVLKGAVQKVLNATITTGVYAENDHGRLTVEFDRDINEQEILEIEKQANAKIQENVPIQVLDMQRAQAEQQFGNKIYDKFPIPSHIKNLKVIVIDDWNWNCCIGQHFQKTGEIGTIKITKTRFRNSRNELEISFDIS
ncbi:MAG: alanyl-tRNA editing protein [Candidatus Woesearchaeota archaeon]|nr:alanyl-tRNA editing protein [Candidatus Woesearchaeota archaeon]